MSNRGLSSSPYKSRLEKKKKDKKRARILGGPKLRGRKSAQQRVQIDSFLERVTADAESWAERQKTEEWLKNPLYPYWRKDPFEIRLSGVISPPAFSGKDYRMLSEALKNVVLTKTIPSASVEALNGSANRQESIYKSFSFYNHKEIDLRDYVKVHGRPLTTNGFHHG
ncbi:hypothetical protein [Klebsiella phage phiKp_32]|nr:hypothetical protein [Klebsiella phage phiKp_32]